MVTASRGRRLVMMNTTGGMQCCHVNQLRPRHPAMVTKQVLCATRYPEQQPSPCDLPSPDQPPGGGNIKSTDLSLCPSWSPSEAGSSTQTASELPRCSTHIRRQPDRPGFV
ncbi:hypothetical protein MRX96_023404 [Rhipicephalus microplus]